MQETDTPLEEPEAIAELECPGTLISALAELPTKAILDEARLAHFLQVSPRTLRRMVARFELPPAITLGGRSMWVVGRILDYIEARAESAERDATRPACTHGAIRG